VTLILVGNTGNDIAGGVCLLRAFHLALSHSRAFYLMAAPHFDVADTLQDAQQDGIIR
jgi:hypothetical protein